MNKFLRDMLMSKYGGQDGRNPYGSRGGYVTSSRRRDRDMQDYEEDYAKRNRGGNRDREMSDMRRGDYGYDMARRDMNYGNDMNRSNYDYARRSDYGNMQNDMRSNSSSGDYARRQDREQYNQQDGHYPYMGGGMFGHYPPMDYGYDMARGGKRDYGNDYGYDYGEVQFGKMSKKDYEEWKEMLVNEDGSQGEHFKKEQVEQIARQLGINLEEMGGEKVFCMAMNMLYSDYCGVAKKYGVDRPEYYADLAKAFLHDKDYKGKPEEKLWIYYKAIVEKED